MNGLQDAELLAQRLKSIQPMVDLNGYLRLVGRPSVSLEMLGVSKDWSLRLKSLFARMQRGLRLLAPPPKAHDVSSRSIATDSTLTWRVQAKRLDTGHVSAYMPQQSLQPLQVVSWISLLMRLAIHCEAGSPRSLSHQASQSRSNTRGQSLPESIDELHQSLSREGIHFDHEYAEILKTLIGYSALQWDFYWREPDIRQSSKATGKWKSSARLQRVR